MPAKRRAAKKAREPLSRERILTAAVTIADADGVGALSMRRLGEELGVEAMSLYGHVANKDDLLDGLVDLVVAEIEVPSDDDWKNALRRRAHSTHEVLLRHPWAAVLIESRTHTGPARLRYYDWLIGTLRQAGFAIELAYHAFLTLDSYIYGFTLQEVSWPFEAEQRPAAIEATKSAIEIDRYPWMREMMEHVMSRALPAASPRGAYASEFEFGLELVLDGLERAMPSSPAR